MAGDIYPRFRATAVQAAPVFLDREATISTPADWVAKARDVGTDLVVFGESFIPAFPLWNMLYAPVDQHAFYRRWAIKGQLPPHAAQQTDGEATLQSTPSLLAARLRCA